MKANGIEFSVAMRATLKMDFPSSRALTDQRDARGNKREKATATRKIG